MANGPTVPISASKTPLFKLLLEIAKDLTLNDIEVIAWAVILDKYIWPHLDTDILTQLQFSALCVKEILNSDSSGLMSAIAQSSRSATFIDDFTSWRDMQEMSVSG